MVGGILIEPYEFLDMVVPLEVRQNVWLQLDGAPTHYDQIVRQFLIMRLMVDALDKEESCHGLYGSRTLFP